MCLTNRQLNEEVNAKDSAWQTRTHADDIYVTPSITCDRVQGWLARTARNSFDRPPGACNVRHLGARIGAGTEGPSAD